MANKALITRRAAMAADVPLRSAIATMRPGAFVVEAETPAGLLIRGADSDYEALAAAGFRVKLLPDTHLLRIGRYTIDVTADAIPDVPDELDVTAAELPGWPHHLVQLTGPPLETWVREIEARGVDVVEPLSEYALFVYTTADLLNFLRDLPFVAWTGPFKPAYRMAPGAPPTTDYVSVSVYPSSEADRVTRSIEDAHGRILDQWRQPAAYGGEYAIFRVQGATLEALARIPYVRWVEAVPRTQPDGERESQIVAENLDGVAPPARIRPGSKRGSFGCVSPIRARAALPQRHRLRGNIQPFALLHQILVSAIPICWSAAPAVRPECGWRPP